MELYDDKKRLCDDCGKTFENQHTLQLHKETDHQDEQLFDLFGFSNIKTEKEDLKMHRECEKVYSVDPESRQNKPPILSAAGMPVQTPVLSTSHLISATEIDISPAAQDSDSFRMDATPYVC